MNKIGFFGVALLIVLGLLGSMLFVVDQRQFGVVYQLGQIKDVITQPGLNFKWPAPFQNVSYIDKRLLTLDSMDTEPLLTAEKQRVVIDWYVRWRISDPQAYIRNVGLDENAGALQLNRVVRNAFQEEINRRTVRELISTRRETLMADVKREVLETVRGSKPWGVDVVATGSQKALMLPPGLGFVAVNDRAWAAAESFSSPAYYNCLKAYRKALAADFDAPYTPAIPLVVAARKSLASIREEGIENIWAKSSRLARATRAAGEAIGLTVFSRRPSDSVTALCVPEGIDDKVLRARLRNEHGVMIAGDAAHLMPVWQGQGYNSGIRDAFNLGWKLAAVVNGQAGDSLLDTYDVERRKHARAMIDLSTMVGRVISPTNRRVASLRDKVIRAASVVPTLKSYVLEMRFKPMPRYERGAVVHAQTPPAPGSVVGTLFIQPRVDTREQQNVLLDDVIGPGFAVLCWNNDPRRLLGGAEFTRWKALGAKFIALRSQTQLHWDAQGGPDPDVTVVGDRTGALKKFFDTQTDSVLFLRPDRCIAGACIAQRAPELSAALIDKLTLIPGGTDGPGPLLHVAQPTTEPSGSLGGTA